MWENVLDLTLGGQFHFGVTKAKTEILAHSGSTGLCHGWASTLVFVTEMRSDSLRG